MQDLLNKLDKKQYKLMAVMARILGDLFSSFYLISELKKEKIVILYIRNALKYQGQDFDSLDPHMVELMKTIVINTTAVTLTLMLILHIVIYYFYYKETSFSKKYVVFISWFGLILTGWMVIEGIKDFEFTQLLNIFSLPLFIFVILGHKKFFPKTSEPQSADSRPRPN